MSEKISLDSSAQRNKFISLIFQYIYQLIQIIIKFINPVRVYM